MGGVISSTISYISLGLTWCFCKSAGAVCSSCLDNESLGTTGRRRSVFLLTLSIMLSLLFQYVLAPALSPHSNTKLTKIPYLGKHLVQAWNQGCDEFDGTADECRGHAGVYRVSFATTLFFLLALVGAAAKPAFNRQVWSAKYALYLFAVLITVFIPNQPLFLPVYIVTARILATVFIIMQQVILIDVAYRWNDAWTDNAERAEIDVGYGAGQSWLRSLLLCAGLLFCLSLTLLIVLFQHFGGCPSNNAILWLTLLGIVLATLVQLRGEHGSLLTSSILALYAVYLAYNAVSKNPHGAQCNPMLGHNDALGVCIGMALTLVSLAWTGWAYTSEENLAVASGNDGDSPLLLYQEDTGVSGAVVNDTPAPSTTANTSASDDANLASAMLWQLNAVLAFVSGFVAVTLTGWGTLATNVHDGGAVVVAHPTMGMVNMWMIAVSQWVAVGLYVWTLVAPELFPDRDFS